MAQFLAARENIHRRVAVLRPGVDCEVRFSQHHCAGEAGALELVEGRVHGREAGRSHHFEALRAEALSVEEELRIAAAAGEVTDEMQTVHFPCPPKCEGEARVGSLAFDPRLAAHTALSIALNSFKTS